MRELVARVARPAAPGRAGRRAGRAGPAARSTSATWRSTRRPAGRPSAGEEVHLTPTEFDLLACLAAAPGDGAHPRAAARRGVGLGRTRPGTRTVDSHVKALRAKLGADLVRTVHGVGYALEDPA